MNGLSSTNNASVSDQIAYIQNLVRKGGPEPYEWPELNRWIESIAIARKKNLISEDDLNRIRSAFGDSLSLKTIQGLGFLKPRGYAGDFEVIDRVYTNFLSNDSNLRRWDEFMHTQDSVKAVRNRKDYFKQFVIRKCFQNKGKEVSLLNLASGPARDVAELLSENPHLNLKIDCVEMDADAIHYAKSLLHPNTSVNFIHKNVFKFQADKSYDLIWSSGLFDYFNDTDFKLILTRLLKCLSSTGELAVGNFQPDHGTFYYLQLIDWHLYHRSSNELLELAAECGVHPGCAFVSSEPLGVNLFLHIRHI